MAAPRHARPRPPRQSGRSLPTAVLVLCVALGVAVVGAGLTWRLGHSSREPVAVSLPGATTPSAAHPSGSAGPAAGNGGKHNGKRAAKDDRAAAPTLTGRKKIIATHGTVTVVTAVWVQGASTVAVRVPATSDVKGLSQLRVERVTGARMHPFTGTVALRPGTVLRLRSSYRWNQCPTQVPRSWPQPFVLPDHVRMHWQRIDEPLHARRALCQQ